jgi:hypothetical protein
MSFVGTYEHLVQAHEKARSFAVRSYRYAVRVDWIGSV